MDPPRLRLCRDCLRKESQGSARCAHCGSPRTISLDDAAGLTTAHVDCDAFYAAVEKRDDPSLNDKLSIDEAFLDLNGCEPSNGAGAAETLARFARRVEVEIGITVSVGLSYCKFLAKLASDLNKPRGFAFLSREEAKAWLAPQSVERLWGVGRVGRERLERSGFRSIGDLQRIDERDAVLRLGEDGLRLWRLAQGRDDRSVSPERETKSVSGEMTFDRDIADKAE